MDGRCLPQRSAGLGRAEGGNGGAGRHPDSVPAPLSLHSRGISGPKEAGVSSFEPKTQYMLGWQTGKRLAACVPCAVKQMMQF